MQTAGKVQYLKYHQGSVRGVAFHPKDRYIFCSGAYDGHINIYSAQKCQLLQKYAITTVSLARNINAVRFTSDGSKIIATSTARRLAVIDVERGEQLLSYDNCVFNGRDRTGLAVDPITPNIIVCCCVNGRGLSIFDLRMPLPLDFLYDMHPQGIIRDVTFLPNTWPWCKGQRSLLTVGTNGMCKVTTLDGRTLHVIDAGQSLNTVAPTPEPYDSALDDGFTSLLMLGGDYVSAYVSECGVKEILQENLQGANHNIPIWKLRYTSNGSTLYSACDAGIIRKYRRWPDRHQFLGELFQHKSDVEDMDISPYDEYLVTASKDKSVGVLKLGPPNHGVSEYSELT